MCLHFIYSGTFSFLGLQRILCPLLRLCSSLVFSCVLQHRRSESLMTFLFSFLITTFTFELKVCLFNTCSSVSSFFIFLSLLLLFIVTFNFESLWLTPLAICQISKLLAGLVELGWSKYLNTNDQYLRRANLPRHQSSDTWNTKTNVRYDTTTLLSTWV